MRHTNPRTNSAQQARFLRTRLLRFYAWALTMCTTTYIVAEYRPHSVVMVPCVFLAIMVPAVLLPLNRKEDRQN